MPTDDLMRPGDHFPLGEAFSSAPIAVPVGSEAARPFGLRYASAPAAGSLVELDLSLLSYDPLRQIALVAEDDGSFLPAMKHTSTSTKTSTGSHDRKGADSDTDSTGR
jgi:putative ATP-grasp target RiPP